MVFFAPATYQVCNSLKDIKKRRNGDFLIKKDVQYVTRQGTRENWRFLETFLPKYWLFRRMKRSTCAPVLVPPYTGTVPEMHLWAGARACSHHCAAAGSRQANYGRVADYRRNSSVLAGGGFQFDASTTSPCSPHGRVPNHNVLRYSQPRQFLFIARGRVEMGRPFGRGEMGPLA
jgi:hypothetical protein